MRTRYPHRRPVRRLAEVPRLHRGRRALQDREACGVRDRDSVRDRFDDSDEYDELGERPERPPRSRRSRKYSRGRDAIETARTERRARGFGRDEERGMGRGRRPSRARDSAEDELMDLDLDAILEVPEDEIEEDFAPVDDAPAEDAPEGECPAGCVPEEKVDEALDEVEEELDEVKDEDAKDDDKEEKEDDDKDDDKKEAAVEPVTEAAAEPDTTAKWAPVFTEADVQRLDKSAEVVLVPFFQQEDPSYVVLANARPVGEVRMSDLTNVDPQDRYALFTDEAFPIGITQAAEQLGAANVLSDLGLRYYASMVTQRQADAAAKTQVQSDLEEAFQTRAASLKQNFINNVLLAVEASNKNLFLVNPLRDAVRTRFRQAGIPDAVAVDLFEDAMQEAGQKYFRALVEQADEWLGFEKEALAQIEQTIGKSGYRHPVDAGMPVEADVYGAEHSAASRTVPVRTMAPAPRREAANEPSAVEQQVKNILRNAGTVNRGK